MEHDARYDRADEFMDVVLGHWNTWEDDALILDKANNRFADSAKVHRLDHGGHYFRSRGPFSVRPSPQGHPVLIQDKRSIIEGTAREIDALVLLSEVLNYDFASKPIDEPFTDAELTEFSFRAFGIW